MVGSAEGSAVPVKTHIERAAAHHIHVCKKLDKINKLCEILAPIVASSSDRHNHGDKKILVLVKPEQDNIIEIASYLEDKDWPVLQTVEDSDSATNEKVWNEFTTMHELKILVTHSSFKHLSESKIEFFS
jgi:hypothetical protein